MESTEGKKPLPVLVDAETVREMSALAYTTEYRVVRRYVHNPQSEVKHVMLVHPDYDIAEVTALFCTYGPEAASSGEKLQNMGVVEVCANTPETWKPGIPLVDGFPNSADCTVILQGNVDSGGMLCIVQFLSSEFYEAGTGGRENGQLEDLV